MLWHVKVGLYISLRQCSRSHHHLLCVCHLLACPSSQGHVESTVAHARLASLLRHLTHQHTV
jgi:hypothetical protein